MLPDRFRELLTAYIDGELSARQRKGVQRLLHRSAEARQRLETLQKAPGELQMLGTPPLGFDVSDAGLRQIRERRPQPGRRRLPPRPAPPIPIWTGLAVAAAVLLVV